MILVLLQGQIFLNYTCLQVYMPLYALFIHFMIYCFLLPVLLNCTLLTAAPNSNQRDHEEGPRQNLAPSRLPIQVHMTEIELEPSMREKGQGETSEKQQVCSTWPKTACNRQACWAVSHANSTKMVQCKQNSLITEAVAKPGQVRPRQLQLQRQRIKGA